ncbi:MAG: DinB family protein [Terriglobales bacterium]
MTAQEFKAKLDAAEKSPEKIAAAVLQLPRATLHYKPAPDRWCILEILGHLADMEILYGYRIRQMIADKEPTIAPVDQDAWARNLGYCELSAPEAVALYSLNRRANLRLLRRLRPDDLERSAFHPEYRRQFKLAEIVERMAAHGPNHLEQIERLKKHAA